MGFNSGFKGLTMTCYETSRLTER